MFATLIKTVVDAQLRTEGKKRLAKNPKSASGHAFVAIADAMDAVDLSNATTQTARNMAAGFRAAADELDKAGEGI